MTYTIDFYDFGAVSVGEDPQPGSPSVSDAEVTQTVKELRSSHYVRQAGLPAVL
ncbi:MAG TPA: hypothetical protein VIV12_02210 [Streptosporangiaceae bacterium]